MNGESFADALPAGTRVGPVVLERAIGQGAWGIVYEGRHDYWGRVAVKEFFPSAYARRTASNGVGVSGPQWQDAVRKGLARFSAEGQALRAIRYENVVPVLDFVEQDGSAFLVMEFIEGETLSAAIEAGRFRDPGSVMALGATLAGTLAAIHAKNILHRDIAPDNIMIRPDGTPVLIDFGGAAAAIASATRSTQNIVKDGYSPPEQYDTSDNAAFPVGPWSDIYATAAVLYRLVSGREPPVSNTRLLSSGIRGQSDPLKPLKAQPANGYPTPWLAAVDAALSLVPADRPQNANAWQRLFDGSSIQKKTDRAAWPMIAGAAVAVAIAITAVAGFFIVHDHQTIAALRPEVAAMATPRPVPTSAPKRSAGPRSRPNTPPTSRPTPTAKPANPNPKPVAIVTPRTVYVTPRAAPVSTPRVVYVQATPKVVYVPAEPAPQRTPAVAYTPAPTIASATSKSAVDPVIGLWRYDNGNTLKFFPNGTVVNLLKSGEVNLTGGTWVRNGSRVTGKWNDGLSEAFSVSNDGKSITNLTSKHTLTRIR